MQFLILRALSFVLLAVGSSTVYSQSKITGPGQGSVTTNGAAQYTIPIELSGATGGMIPDLTLTYNSQVRDGIVGMGWSLAGWPIITRCPRTVAQDGIRAGISYTTEDKFCLDGERLIPVGNGGTEFRTERETYAKIMSVGVRTGGPYYFVVKTKSGLTMTFMTLAMPGYEPDPSTVPARYYPLTQVSDNRGNYYSIGYASGVNNFSTVPSVNLFYPSSITYSGNANASVGPQQSITFIYELRGNAASNARITYQGGKASANDRILTSIQIQPISDPSGIYFRKYNLSYVDASDASGVWDAFYPHLKSVEFCHSNTDNSCLKPLIFTWQTGTQFSQTFNPTATGDQLPGAFGDYQHLFADVNGDGKKQRFKIRRSVDTFIGNSTTPVGSPDSYAHYLADVDGDGKLDWIRVGLTNNSASVALGLGNGNFNFWTNIITSIEPATTHNHYFADVNGDGRADWIQVSKTGDNTKVALATGGGNFTFWSTSQAIGANVANFEHSFVDVNSDGNVDWILRPRVTAPVEVRLSNGAGGFVAGTSVPIGNDGLVAAKYYLADMNGDGLIDLIRVTPANVATNTRANVFESLGRGDGTFAQWVSMGVSNSSAITENYFININGDETADWIQIGANGTCCAEGTVSFHIYRNITYGSTDFQPLHPSTTERFFEDIDGDGRSDMIEIDKSTNVYKVRTSIAERADRMLSVKDGYGLTTSFTYSKALTAHTPSTGAVYPLRDFRGQVLDTGGLGMLQTPSQLYLVSSASYPTGGNSNRIENYKYGGLKLDLAGRGWQGFQWMTSEHVYEGLLDRVEYRQDWPYSGLPSLTRKTTTGGTPITLSETINTYGCKDFVSATGCTVALGRRYFPYLSQSVSSVKDLNGVVMPGNTIAVQIDDFGNPVLATVTTTGGFRKITTNNYNNDTNKWWIGQLIRQSVQSTVP
jgi:hypothetical protein